MVVEETGLINWNQVDGMIPCVADDNNCRTGTGGVASQRLFQCQMEGSGEDTIDSVLWHGKSYRPF